MDWGEMPGMLNLDWGMLTSASLEDVQRSHSLRTCLFQDFAMIQCNMAQVFLDYHMEAEDNVPQILKERAAARRW